MFSILSRRCPLLATSLSVLFCLLSMLISDSRFDLVWFRLSCDHGWIRSGSVNVRKTTTRYSCCCFLSCIRNRSDLCSVPFNIRTGPTDANAFRCHRLTTQKRVHIMKNQREIRGPRKVNTHAIVGTNIKIRLQTVRRRRRHVGKMRKIEPIAPTRHARPSNIKQTRRIKDDQ